MKNNLDQKEIDFLRKENKRLKEKRSKEKDRYYDKMSDFLDIVEKTKVLSLEQKEFDYTELMLYIKDNLEDIENFKILSSIANQNSFLSFLSENKEKEYIKEFLKKDQVFLDLFQMYNSSKKTAKEFMTIYAKQKFSNNKVRYLINILSLSGYKYIPENETSLLEQLIPEEHRRLGFLFDKSKILNTDGTKGFIRTTEYQTTILGSKTQKKLSKINKEDYRTSFELSLAGLTLILTVSLVVLSVNIFQGSGYQIIAVICSMIMGVTVGIAIPDYWDRKRRLFLNKSLWKEKQQKQIEFHNDIKRIAKMLEK